jgi:hypothetical protein
VDGVAFGDQGGDGVAKGFVREDLEPGAFDGGGSFEFVEDGVGDLAGFETLAVGVTGVDVFGEGSVGGDIVIGRGEMDGGEEIVVVGIGEQLDAGGEAFGGGGDAEVEKGAAAADGKFAIERIVDGEGAGTIGVEEDRAVIDAETPGLGVVAGGGAESGFEDGDDGVIQLDGGG